MKVLLDTSPLGNANAVRGVGIYTRLLKEFLGVSDQVELVKTKPDITHYPFFDLFFDTLPVLKIGKRVVTIHDVIPLRFPQYYPAGVKGKLKLQKQKLALKQVEAVITDSEASKADIVEFLGIDPKKIEVIYLAGNPKLQKTSNEEVARVTAAYELPEKYVLYVGDINYNKNLPQLIKAVRNLPQKVKLVCVGRSFYPHDIPEWQKIETQLALSDVEDRVIFVSNILGDGDADLAAIYSGATVYCQPSLYEGFGLPVLEAMQCRVPVVAAQNSSLLEVGQDHVKFVGTEADQIAAGIIEVLDWSKTKRQQQITAAYQWSQTFTWEKVVAETIEVYQRVLGHK